MVSFMNACGSSTNHPSNPPSSESPDSILTIEYLAVGFGDAALIQCDGKAMLIDGGGKAQSQKLYAILKEKNLDQLECIVATCLDEEHIGGLAGALKFASAKSVFVGNDSGSTDVFHDFKKYADKNGGGLKVVSEEVLIELGNAKVKILPIDSAEEKLMIHLIYDEMSFLFVPDMIHEIFEKSVSTYSDLQADVVKLPNHGNDNVSAADLIKTTSMKHAVISAGKQNLEKYTLSELEIASIELYRTDLQGDILCTSNGKTVSFQPKKTVDPSKLYDIENEASSSPAETNQPTDVPVLTPEPSSKPLPTPTPVPTSNSSLKASIDEIYEANLLSNLVRTHGSVKNTSYFDGTSYITGSFLVEDKIANLFTMIRSDGTCTYNGWFDGYTYYDNGARVVMDVFVEQMDGDTMVPGEQDMAYYFLYDDEIVYEGKKDNTYIFNLNLYDTPYTLTVDCDSLALLKVEWKTAEGTDKIEYIYGEWIPGQDIMNCWTNESGLKMVSVYADLIENGKPMSLYRPFYLPVSWELDVVSMKWDVFKYMDPYYSVPYSYPEDGKSYEIYVTNAAG